MLKTLKTLLIKVLTLHPGLDIITASIITTGVMKMAIPCKCYECARCTQFALNDEPYCLAIELAGCDDRNCEEWNFECSRFTKDKSYEKKKTRGSIHMALI